MINIVQKFKRERNLSKFLIGGSIPKLLLAWLPLYTNQQRATLEWGRLNAARTTELISDAVRQADERIEQRERAKDAGYKVNIDAGTISKSNSNKKFVTTSGAFIPSLVIIQSSSSIIPHMEEAADFLGNNPALLLAEDMDRATPNRIIESLIGVRPFKGRTITNLPSLQKQELINQVKFAKERGYNNFNSDLYNQMYNYNYGSKTGPNGEDRSGLWARMNTPRARIEHTLGLYNFYTDKNGNTIVVDTYDFNDDLKQRGEGKYANIRNGIAVTYGSRSSDPDEGKIKYRINLGKI